MKNQNVTGVNLKGIPAQGVSKPSANMPANNHGTFPTKIGAGQHSSKFGNNVKPATAQKGVNQSMTGGKANTPANNITDNKVVIGHTKHGVGEVPNYLKGRS